jgi:5-methyltetrahydrofolate--homocysteine methyltransferase
MSTLHPLEQLLRERIAIIDGAMGTTIRTYGMTEADVRGERFKDAKKDLLNCGDFFSLTQPKMICDIHRRFLEAGADIIETNTFGVTSIALSDFFVEDPREHGGRKDSEFFQKIIEDKFLNDLSWEMSETSARQCREWADRVGNATGRQRFVAGRRRFRVSRGHFRSGEDGLHAPHSRADRGRLRRDLGGDDFRFAEREGGARRGAGGF